MTLTKGEKAVLILAAVFMAVSFTMSISPSPKAAAVWCSLSPHCAP